MFRYTCPTCNRTIEVSHREEAPSRPFCCKRCQMIDLGKWLTGEYAIGKPLDSSDDESLETDSGKTLRNSTPED